MTYFDEVMADAPAGYWRCDETAGASVVVDSSGNGRNGTYPAAQYFLPGQPGLLAGDPSTSVKWGYGAQDFATIPYGAWMDATQFTYECLFKLESMPGPNLLLSRYYSNNAQFRWLIATDGTLRAETFNGGWSSLATAAGVVQIGVPYHVAWTWTSSAATLRLTNLNAGAIVTASGVTTKNPLGAPDLYWGANGTDRLRGWLDEVAFYPQVLSNERLQAHADAAMGVGQSPPSGSLSGVAPGVTASFDASLSVPPNNGSLAGVAPGVTAAFAGGDPNAVTGALAGQAPAVYAAVAGSTEAPPVAAVVSSDEYANYGYNYDGLGLVDYDPPIAESPAQIKPEKVRRVHQSLPAPTLVDGRPT